jgi:hypothetical protein
MDGRIDARLRQSAVLLGQPMQIAARRRWPGSGGNDVFSGSCVEDPIDKTVRTDG